MSQIELLDATSITINKVVWKLFLRASHELEQQDQNQTV